MATDWDFNEALKAFPENVGALDVRDTAKDGSKVAQNAAHQSSLNQEQSSTQSQLKPSEIAVLSMKTLVKQIAEAGIEPARPLRGTGF